MASGIGHSIGRGFQKQMCIGTGRTAKTASPPEVDLNNIATQAGQQLVIGRHARPGHHRSEGLPGEHEPRPVGQAGYHDDLDAAVATHPPVSAPQLQAGRCPYIIHLMNTHCG